MKRTDLSIVAGVGMLALIAAFWFVVLSPKRTEANDLATQVTELEASVAAQEQLASTAVEAEESYDENYHRMVVLGKAVPKEADTASLLVEVQGISQESKVSFDSLALSQAAATGAAPVATPPPLTSPTDPSGEAPPEGETPEAAATETTPTSTDAAAPPAPTAAPATEATAASLPLGATVGPASLPIMPYDLTFTGGFYEIADFMEGLDGFVKANEAGAGVSGRLLTVDGFSLEPLESAAGGAPRPDPPLAASLAVTTYVAPAEEGVTAGATPTAPATTPAATPTPASSTTPAP